MNLTAEQKEIAEQYNINQDFSQELLNDQEFRIKWTSYLLSIQYNTVVQLIPVKVLIKETNRILGE